MLFFEKYQLKNLESNIVIEPVSMVVYFQSEISTFYLNRAATIFSVGLRKFRSSWWTTSRSSFPFSSSSTRDNPCGIQGSQVSISPTFYRELFCTKVFCAAFQYLQFVFVTFLAKGNWQKSCLLNVGKID